MGKDTNAWQREGVGWIRERPEAVDYLEPAPDGWEAWTETGRGPNTWHTLHGTYQTARDAMAAMERIAREETA